MPLVRMLTSSASQRHDWQAGEVVNMTDEEAAAWADGERGVLIEDRAATPERGRAVERRAPGHSRKYPS